MPNPQIKILAKSEGNQTEYFSIDGGRQGFQMDLNKFASQEKVIEDGIEVPEYELLIAPEHPALLSVKIIGWDNIGWDKSLWSEENKDWPYEISFVDSEDLLKKQGEQVEKKDRRKRLFNLKSNIAIINNCYSNKLEKLKNLNNLMPEEENIWKVWIKSFRQELAQETDKNSSKYQNGRKFIEELESELNKKTGKGNDNNRERERTKLRNCENELRN